MTHTLILSDALHTKLKITAQKRGFNSIEQMLENWLAEEVQAKARSESVERINNLRKKLHKKYGEMPDSVDLLQEDRAR